MDNKNLSSIAKVNICSDRLPISIEDYHFDIEDDKLIRYEPIEKTKSGGTLCKREPIMTKEAFLLCAKEWLGIDPKDFKEEADGSN